MLDDQGVRVETGMHEHLYRKMKLHEMSVPESLLVVSLRLWLLERTCRRGSARPDWRGGLCAIGFQHIAADVVEPLFDFLYGNRQGVEVLPLHCTGISREESNLLTCVLLAQHQRTGELKQLLGGYTFPAPGRVVTALLARFAQALEEAGMVLALRTVPPPAQGRRPAIAARVH